MLIAGASGTGKSVGLNSLLVSWFYKYSPADLRLIIVDPKLVEFKVFEGIPHLLFGDIITDAKTAVAMLNWAVKEMEARYTKMAELVVHNIDEYNDLIDPRKDRKLPKIVIIIDEFADLMSTDKRQSKKNRKACAESESCGNVSYSRNAKTFGQYHRRFDQDELYFENGVQDVQRYGLFHDYRRKRSGETSRQRRPFISHELHEQYGKSAGRVYRYGRNKIGRRVYQEQQ